MDLELYDLVGIYCESLLEKLREKHMPKDALLKTKMAEEFFAYKREGRLGDSVARLSTLVLECRKAGYVPDDSTLQMKSRLLLRI